jgi:hypothetical protein
MDCDEAIGSRQRRVNVERLRCHSELMELGAVLAANRMNAVGEKRSLPDLFVPIVLASALVVRVIKTSSEIIEWNKR